MISIKNLSKQYGKHRVLNNLNLQFMPGNVYGIVGENGAGKTTLFRCIAGLEQYEGEINAPVNPLKDHLGLLVAEPFFFPKVTGEEYIQLLCNARNVPIDAIAEKNIFDLPLKQYAAVYSTGMKKKLALTAILLQENQYFIFDEPFNGVDIQSNMIITDIMHKLKSLNKTVIISSHIFATLKDTCDEIHLLKNGHIEKTVLKDNFDALEFEMKQATVGKKIEQLKLR